MHKINFFSTSTSKTLSKFLIEAFGPTAGEREESFFVKLKFESENCQTVFPLKNQH